LGIQPNGAALNGTQYYVIGVVRRFSLGSLLFRLTNCHCPFKRKNGRSFGEWRKSSAGFLKKAEAAGNNAFRTDNTISLDENFGVIAKEKSFLTRRFTAPPFWWFRFL